MDTIMFPLEAEVTLTTPFQDADPMGVVYHGNYFRYFEETRRVLLDKIQYGYIAMSEAGHMWPVIDTRVKYVKAIPFHHQIRIHAKLTEWENRLRIDYVIYDAETGKRMCKAHTTQVAVGIEDKEMCFVSPKIFLDKVEHWHKTGECLS